MRDDILDREDEIREWVSEGKSLSFMCDILKCKYETLRKYLKLLGIKYSGNQSGKGVSKPVYKDIYDYLENGCCRSFRIKQLLVSSGIKDDCCEMCGARKWLGKYLPLELHHKDGNHFNNDIDNLMILCPNCHSVQDGNSGANIGAYDEPEYKRYKSKDVEECSNEGESYEIQKKRDIILRADVDFSKYGWVTKLYNNYPELHIKRQDISKWIKEYMPELYNTCYIYKRDRPHIYDGMFNNNADM